MPRTPELIDPSAAAKTLSALGASKGGKARAEKLTAEERADSARKAAIARWDNTPKATHDGTLKIVGKEIACAVLDTKQRVLTQETFLTALGRAAKAKGGTGSTALVDGMPPFLAAKNLKPFISEELRRSTAPIVYRTTSGGRAFGFDAALLPMICEVYLKLRDAGPVPKQQQRIVDTCDILMRGLATVGIIALVDEATGFQDDRAREALQEILDKFIQDELGKWARRFPNEFYRQIFRLRGWEWSEKSVRCRPGVVGHWTVDLVYKRLAPGVLDQLRKKTPRDSKGRLKHRLHQWLTEDVGHPRLQEHLSAVIALMKVNQDGAWDSFQSMVDLALPVYSPQMTLPFVESL